MRRPKGTRVSKPCITGMASSEGRKSSSKIPIISPIDNPREASLWKLSKKGHRSFRSWLVEKGRSTLSPLSSLVSVWYYIVADSSHPSCGRKKGLSSAICTPTGTIEHVTSRTFQYCLPSNWTKTSPGRSSEIATCGCGTVETCQKAREWV